MRAVTFSSAVFAMLALATLADTARAQDGRVYSIDDKDVIQPTAIKKVQPEYDEAARADKIEGIVEVDIVISKTGKPRDVRVRKGLDPRLDGKAVSAAEQWEFDPARLKGLPVDYSAVLQLTFKLIVPHNEKK